MGPVTEQSEHLSSAQIENYGIRTSGAGPEAAQRDEHQRLDHQSSDDQRVNDREINDRPINNQQINDRQVDDLKISDLKIDDQQSNDQRVEAHLADCASCRNRLLEFHRSLFASSAYPPEPDRPNADKPKNDELKTDPPEHDTSLSGHSPSGHLSSGQTPADSNLEGARPTDSALADSKFANPKYPVQAQVRTAATPECPSDDALRQLAAGLTPEDVAPKLTQHVATCNYCGPLLQTYTEIFSDDFSPEEQAALANLKSGSAEWQQQTAREMFKRSLKPARGAFSWKWIMMPAPAAAACALLALGIGITLYARRDTPEKVERLFAQEYKENRQLAVRFPDTPFANMHTTRGSEQSRLSQSRSLLKAENIISQHRQEASKDIGWLRVGAKADILDGRPGAAIAVLSPALARYPDSVPLAMDLAVARFELAETSGDAQSYQMAQDLLTQVLAREPKNCVALFNRAVVLERLRRPEMASADWKATLQCESDPAWAAEARAKLDALVESGDKL